ncbi:MAG: hypothetical protein LC780_07625 [Acidobacteria bacterium]|nr:hypothetical protein [Acidobacteriota bacterium]
MAFLSLFAAAANVPAFPSTARTGTCDAIQGIRPGSDFDEVKTVLAPFGPTSRSPEREEEREEKRRGVWSLARGDYETIVVESDEDGRVSGVTGFVRKGREIPFTRLGSRAAAARWMDSAAIWNVPMSRGGYKLIAKGPEGRARVVTLLWLAAPAVD